jgi:hypothetical protein
MAADSSGRAVQGVGLRPLVWVRIPPGAWMSVSCVCCVLSGRGLCVGLDHSYREILSIVECLSVIVQPRPGGGPGSLGGCHAVKTHTHTHTQWLGSWRWYREHAGRENMSARGKWGEDQYQGFVSVASVKFPSTTAQTKSFTHSPIVWFVRRIIPLWFWYIYPSEMRDLTWNICSS